MGNSSQRGTSRTSIDDAANRFRAKSNEYFTNIQEMDPAVLRIIRGAQETIAEGEDTGEFAELFASILQTVVTSAVITENAIELAAVLRTVSRTTRLIRPQLGAISAGLRKIEDGQSLMSEWDRRIMDLGLIETRPEPYEGEPEDEARGELEP